MAINPANINTIRVGELAPADFNLTDNIPHEVGTDLRRGTIQELISFIAPLLSAIQFEEKTLHVNQQYIDDNFDPTGLGINLMTGYAIINGNNGTTNIDGKVGVAYGATYNVIGATGGSSTHTLIENQLPIHHVKLFSTPTATVGAVTSTTYPTRDASGSGGGDNDYNIRGNATESTVGKSSNVGGNQPHNNMQPYIVVLKVMKL